MALKEKKDESEHAPKEQQGAVASTAEGTGELSISYDRNTGAILNIYSVDDSGKRQELSEEEYAQFFAAMAEVAAEVFSGEQSGSDADLNTVAIGHQQLGFHQGYFQGLAEYEAALSSQASPYSAEEEAAYNQGISDYHALMVQSQQC